MPRTPKSKKSSSCWTVLSFFSSGLSDRPTTGTTTTATITTPSTPTGTTAAAAATITTERRQKEKKSGSEKESPTSDEKEADPSWIMLHDRDSDPFWLNKNTGHWTYDGITVYGPPAPPAATPTGYPSLWQHPQQQPLPQHVPYAQLAVGYHAPAPYAAVHQGWQHAPPPAGTAVAAAVPGTIPAGTTGVPPVFF